MTSMIPDFNDHGYLPKGIHPATLNEIELRFGRETELRRVQMESIRWLAEVAFRAGILRLIINGSFVTDVAEPNDVDCVLLGDHRFPVDESAAAELVSGFPFLDIQIVNEKGFEEFVELVFATDRRARPKGMIEVTE